MAEEKTIRLNKVLREFNISLDRAVEYLNSKGHEIEARPTTKISEKVYQVLQNQFQIDKSKKVASKEVGVEKRKEKEELRLAREKELDEKKIEFLNNSDEIKLKEKIGFNNLENVLNEENSFDFALSNFRKTKEKWKFDLSPVTFLTGTNNSGKSSVLKSLLVLEDYANSDNHLELCFNGPNYKKHKIDGFSNAVNWDGMKNNNSDIKFEFRRFGFYIQLIFTPQSREEGKILKGYLKKIKVRRQSDDSIFLLDRISEGQYQLYVENDILSIDDGDSSYYSLLQHMGMRTLFENKLKELESKREVMDASELQSISIKQDINKYKKRLSEVFSKIKNLENERKNKLIFNPQFSIKEFKSEKLTLDNIIRKILLKYFDDNKKVVGNVDEKNELMKIMHFGDRIISALKFNIHHLSPQRNSQTRLYIHENTSNDIYELINWHSQHPLIENSDPYLFIQDWMVRFKIGEKFRIKDIEGLASIIEIKENGDWRNIVDKGFGVGQLFSIIFRISLCINDYGINYGDSEANPEKPKPFILIEEPEANLHPKLQSLLADLFYECYLDYGIRFMIETHSEYIMRKSQIIMKEWSRGSEVKNTGLYEEEMEPQPFGAYYFDEKQGPYNMEYRKDGKYKKDFGSGFFDESTNLAFEIL